MIQKQSASTERLYYQENKSAYYEQFQKNKLIFACTSPQKVKAMKQQKLFHLVLSAMLIVCTTGCYDKDEIKDAEKYLFKDIQYSFEEGDGSVRMM